MVGVTAAPGPHGPRLSCGCFASVTGARTADGCRAAWAFLRTGARNSRVAAHRYVRPVPSQESVQIVADLWRLPSSDGLTVSEWRAQAEAGAATPPPPGLRTERVDIGGAPSEWAWYEGGGTGRVVLVLHGGGFVLCSIETHRCLGAEVARACNGRALLVDYRRAPEHPFPAALHDSVDAYRWLLEVEGVEPERIVLFGDSAGGNLCLGTCALARERGLPQPAGLVLASPLTDLTSSGPSSQANRSRDPFSRLDDIDRFADLYLQGASRADPLASPLFADLGWLGPTLILVGPDETLLDDSIRLAERLPEVTLHVLDGAFHTWLGYAGRLPEADAALELIADWAEQTI